MSDSTIFCRCGKPSVECVHTYETPKLKNHAGIIFYGKKKYARSFINKYNKKIRKLIKNGMYEHMQLCNGGDIATGLFTINYQELFYGVNTKLILDNNIKKEDIIHIQTQVERNIMDAINKNKYIGYIKTYAVDVQKQYFSSKVQLYYRFACTLFGNKSKFKNLGYLRDIYHLLASSMDCEIILQILAPTGALCKYKDISVQYKDIFINFTAYGRVNNEESHELGCIREVKEELMLNVNIKDIEPMIVNTFHIMYKYDVEKNKYEFDKVVKENCSKCIQRNSQHKHFTYENNL